MIHTYLHEILNQPSFRNFKVGNYALSDRYNYSKVHAISDYKKQWSEVSAGVSKKLPISRRWPFLNSSRLSVGCFLVVS